MGAKKLLPARNRAYIARVLAALMRDLGARYRDLAERLDRSTEEPLKDLVCDQLPVRLGVRGPHLDSHGG